MNQLEQPPHPSLPPRGGKEPREQPSSPLVGEDGGGGNQVEETIEMPESVLVRCPLVDFQLRPVAKHCPPCPHFRGLADRFPGMTSIVPAKRYFVLCAGAPTKRELIEVAS